MNRPSGVAVDSAGNLYIADYYNFRVRKVSNGVITTVAGNGVFGFSGDGGLAAGAELREPAGVAVDSSGSLYIADTWNNRIRKVSNGVISTVAGKGPEGWCGSGLSGGGSGQLNCPNGVAVDAAGSLYIADSYNNRILKVSNGVITTAAGSGPQGFSGDGGSATSAPLSFPSGVAVDAAGNLYIADTSNQRIREVSNGVIVTVAGNGTGGFGGDNGPATSAELSYPSGIALDSAGNLYVADTDNNRVRVVTSSGPLPLSITTLPTLPSGLTGTAYSLILAAAGGVPPYTWALAVGALPPGLVLSSAGVIGGSATAVGVATFSVTVTDADSTTASKSFSLSIGLGPLAITTPATLPSGLAGAAYSQALAATGGIPPYAWSLGLGALPPGLFLSSAGTITGTPTTAGTAVFMATVTDANSAAASGTFTLTINYAPLVIPTASPLPSGVAGTAYSQTLTATGGVPPYRWQVSSGALPPLLALSSAGVIAGAPITAGVYSFTVQVVDAWLQTVSAPFSLTITLGPLAITTPATLPAGVVGASYSQTLAATGGVPPYTWQVKSGSWPPGLIFSSGGALTGAPSQVGSFSFTVQVTDASGAAASRVFSLPVSAPGCASSLNYSGQAFSAAGGSGTVNVTAPSGCQWTASSQLSWVAITAGASGSGNGAVAFQVAANSGAARSGAIAIAGFPFTVEQSAASPAGLSTIGSIAQVTSGGGWKSTLTLINTGSASEDALVSFFDDFGNPLALPVNYPQAPLAAPALASVIDRTVDPGAELLIETAGP
ncbi:MAG: putative Ig domain-containing protein, partial [Bryobacteraceae bacterium]